MSSGIAAAETESPVVPSAATRPGDRLQLRPGPRRAAGHRRARGHALPRRGAPGRRGFLGVNMFFVLSGFLITSLLLGEWAKRLTIRLGQFWTRRARRLLPALLVMLVGVAIYAKVFATPGGVRRPPARLALDPFLRGQLALHLRREQLLRPDRPAIAPRAHVVALDRGAVLHRVAAGGPVHAAPGPEAPAVETTVADLRHRGGGRHGLGRRHAVVVLRPPHVGDPPLRGHRHPMPGHPGGCVPGHRDGHVGPAPAGLCAEPGRRRRRRPHRGTSVRRHHHPDQRLGDRVAGHPGLPPDPRLVGPGRLPLPVDPGDHAPSRLLFEGGYFLFAWAWPRSSSASITAQAGLAVAGTGQPGVPLHRQDLVRDLSVARSASSSSSTPPASISTASPCWPCASGSPWWWPPRPSIWSSSRSDGAGCGRSPSGRLG